MSKFKNFAIAEKEKGFFSQTLNNLNQTQK